MTNDHTSSNRHGRAASSAQGPGASAGDPPVLYEEVQRPYVIFRVVLVAAFVGSVLSSLLSLAAGERGPGITIGLVAALLLFLWLNFSTLRLRFDGEVLTARFGLFVKRLPLRQVSGVAVERYRLRTYLGWGIRFGLDGSRAWSVRSGEGVVLTVGGRRYFFSTGNPQRLARLIRERIQPV